MVLLALSLASIHHAHEGWLHPEGKFEMRADRWELGAPLPWLSWCKLTVTGDAPAIETVPDGRDYLPGLHTNAVLLGLAVAFAAALTWGVSALRRRFGPVLARQDALPSLRLLALSLVSGALTFVLAGIDHPDWMSWGFMVIPLPAVVIACCWRRPRAWLAAAYLASALSGITIAQMFDEGRPLVDRSLSAKQDVVFPLVLFLLEFLIVAGVLALVRLARRRATPMAS